MKTDNPTVNTSSATTSSWHLRVPGGTVFGPCPLSTLLSWAEQGRIEPGSEMSTDNHSWRPAEDVADLGLEWMIELDSSSTVGPFHIRAIHEFLDDGSITGATSLRNRRTGERTTVAAKRSQIAGTTEVDRATLDLQRAQSELREANVRIATSATELQTTRSKLQGAQAELRASAAELQGTRAELQKTQAELRTVRTELNASKALLATLTPEMESLRFEHERVRSTLDAERNAHKETVRAAAETAAAHQAAMLSATEQGRRREAKLRQETAAVESRMASIAAQVDQKEAELAAAHHEMEDMRGQVEDAARKASESDAKIASLQEQLDRARTEREQQDAVYRREQAEGAAFRIATAQRESELKALVSTLTTESSMNAAERDAARRSESAALERVAGIEKTLHDTKSAATREVEFARNERDAVERERQNLARQLDAAKDDLLAARDKLQALVARVPELERDRDQLAGALHAANTEVKSMRSSIAELTAAIAETTAQRDAARQTEHLQSVINQKESEIADLDRLVNEYRSQIRALADRCVTLESAARVQTDQNQAGSGQQRRRRPMDASNWNFADREDPPPAAPDHPLAGLEAKATLELLDWRRSKGADRKKPG